jgi:hypothetical protein
MRVRKSQKNLDPKAYTRKQLKRFMLQRDVPVGITSEYTYRVFSQRPVLGEHKK